MPTLFDITWFLFGGFFCTVPLLLLLQWLHRSGRALWRRLIVCAQLLLLAASCPLIFFNTAELIATLSDQSTTQGFARAMGPYWYAYWVMRLLYLVPQVLWIRKLRHSHRCAAWMLLVTGTPIVTERIVIYLTGRHQDNRPSSWTYYTYSQGETVLLMLGYCILLLILYKIVYRKQPLPFVTTRRH